MTAGASQTVCHCHVAILKLIRYFDLKTDLFDKFDSQRLFFHFLMVYRVSLNFYHQNNINLETEHFKTSETPILGKFNTNTMYFKIFVNRYVIFGLLTSSSKQPLG